MRADAFHRARCGARGMSATDAAQLLEDADDVAAEEGARAATRPDKGLSVRKVAIFERQHDKENPPTL